MIHSLISKSLGVALAILPLVGTAADSTATTDSTADADSTVEIGPASQTAQVDFLREVQPILAKQCFACHGPDEAESGLSFASESAALAEADSGARAIVPGDPQASELLNRISAADAAERMPPEGDPLSPPQIEILKRWIAQGAPWSKHWAFEPMRRIDPPQVADPLWNEHPIDALLFKSLAAANLQPNRAADRATLIRRAYYDLIGLPPTAAEVKNFVEDPDTDAFARVVDELLQSPHMANAGHAIGWTWCAMPKRIPTNATDRSLTRGSTVAAASLFMSNVRCWSLCCRRLITSPR